ncbi:MAG: PEGA domain-containing protein [Candidatus Taylorbacteria bacterium]|nr:PEGA domain-containing protein [Candidatus Taylorbacteria bacterium]
MQLPKLLAILLLAAAAIICSGCNTVTKATNLGLTRPAIVDSEPQGAQVFLNGNFVGTTPATINASPRRDNQLILTYPGHETREVILKAALWGEGSGMATGGNLAATFISPPVGAAGIVIDRWVTKLDRDFKLPVIKLYPSQAVVMAPPQGQVPCPPDDQSWRPRVPSAVPWLDRQGNPLPQPRQGLTSIPGFVPQCCEPAKSIEEIERERRAALGQR